MPKSPTSTSSSSFVFSVYTPSSFQPSKITKRRKQPSPVASPPKKRNNSYYNDNPNYHYSMYTLEPQQQQVQPRYPEQPYESCLDAHEDIAKRHGMNRWQLKQMVEAAESLIQLSCCVLVK